VVVRGVGRAGGEDAHGGDAVVGLEQDRAGDVVLGGRGDFARGVTPVRAGRWMPGEEEPYSGPMSVQSAGAVSAPEGDPVLLRALGEDRAAEREICARLLPAVRAFAARRL